MHTVRISNRTHYELSEEVWINPAHVAWAKPGDGLRTTIQLIPPLGQFTVDEPFASIAAKLSHPGLK